MNFNLLPAYEKSISLTPRGVIEIKTLPPMTVLQTKEAGSYFVEDNRMFRSLFRYISEKDISMTTPVTVDVEPGAMRFIVSKKDLDRADEPTDNVAVVQLPERTVVSIGYNGRYTKKNYEKHLGMLEEWLQDHASEWEVAGDPIAVYWDGPYKFPAWKKAEVMIPIKRDE